MPNSKPEKSDRDAFAGVSYGDANQAQDACGMTDCGPKRPRAVPQLQMVAQSIHDADEEDGVAGQSQSN